MRKLISNHHISLDGVVQGPGGPLEDPRFGFTLGGWAMHHDDDESGAAMMELMSRDHDLLLGRMTWEIWAAYWPFQDAANPIAAKFNACTKYVASRTLVDPSWDNTVVLEGDAAQAVRALKQTDGPELHLWGSSRLMQTLNHEGLVDEYRLYTYPVVLGSGLKLFDEGTPPFALKPVSCLATPSGTTLQVFHPDGPVPPGVEQPGEPSDAELARRARWLQL